MGRCALALGKVCAGLGELLPKAGKVSISKISAPEGSEGGFSSNVWEGVRGAASLDMHSQIAPLEQTAPEGSGGEGSRPTFSIFCRWSQLAGSSCIVCYVKLSLFSIWKISAPEGSGVGPDLLFL